MEEIKSGFLMKKSQNRRFFTRENYKRRFFVLSAMTLQYYEPSEENYYHKSKAKGCIYLALMKAVEAVQQNELDDYSNSGLQIVYNEDVRSTRILYAVASSEAERNDWLILVRGQAVSRGAKLNKYYHPGIWRKHIGFSCCSNQNKLDAGCQLCTIQLPGDCLQPVATPQSAARSLHESNSQASLHSVSANDNHFVVAIHNFKPLQENQLKLEKSCRYKVIDETNSKWWYVCNSAGEAGYIPTNHIRRPNSLETFDWYYKKINRQRAENILIEGNKEGCFLVRDSISKQDSYTLSVLAKDPDKRDWRVHHYFIFMTNDRRYYLSEKHAFSSIPDLIFYHQHNSGGLVVRLRTPPNRNQEAPVPAGLGFNELEVEVSDLLLEKEPIGRGQFGQVLRGRLRGQSVAVKVMLDGNTAEDDFIEEARSMRNLNHPNLVQLFGVVTKSRPIMIITDYMPFGSLKDFLSSRRQQYLKPNRVPALLDICNQVCAAMLHLEEKNFIHRDLACRNILVKSVLRMHGYIEVKVSDFGMARLLLDQEYDASAGSKFPVRWAAPEVFQCSKYSIKSDVWAFAVLMWEVFTACDTPYQSRDNPGVCQYVTEGGVLEKPRLCPEQQVYIYIMLECWKSNPANRPSFAEIATKFDCVLENENVFR